MTTSLLPGEFAIRPEPVHVHHLQVKRHKAEFRPPASTMVIFVNSLDAGDCFLIEAWINYLLKNQSDIEVIAAIGDSDTAAYLAKGNPLDERGVSWSIGGENPSISTLITLPSDYLKSKQTPSKRKKF
jgi:hypothetical protein